MKIEILTSFAGAYNANAGDVREFPDGIAADLIKHGMAREIKSEGAENGSTDSINNNSRRGKKSGKN